MTKHCLAGLALMFTLGLAGCSSYSPVLPAGPSSPSAAASVPAVPQGGFSLITTLSSATGPQNCVTDISHFHVGESYEGWLLTIQRSGESINLVVSDLRNPTDRYEYEGTVMGDVFTAELEYAADAGWCGGPVKYSGVKDRLTGRFSEGGTRLTAEDVQSVRLDELGVTVGFHFDWTAVQH